MFRPILFDTEIVLAPQPRIEVTPVVQPVEPAKVEEYQAEVLSDLGDFPTFKTTAQDSDLPDPVEMIRRAINSDLDASIFSTQMFDVAPNAVDWCRGHQWLSYNSDLFPRQFEVLARFFEDVCYFCSDADYVHNVPVDADLGNVQDHFCLLQHGVCPNCKRNRTEMLSDWIKDSRYGKYHTWDPVVVPRPVPPNEFVGIWGQRSGKSITTSSFIWTYILHRILALPSPTTYFNMPSNVVLQASFVSPTRGQGNENLWLPFLGAWDGSAWCKKVVQYLKQESKRTGVQLYHRQQTFLIFPGKRLAVHVQAANSANLRGATRVFGAEDEMSHFNFSEDGKRRASVRDGTEVFTSLSNSLRTVRSAADDRRTHGDYDAIDGYMINISSPLDISDPLEQRAAIADKSFRMFFTRHPTWHVNPKEKEDLIREEFAGNPIRFTRDFGAQPPRAANPFIHDEKIADEITVEKVTGLCDIEIQTEQQESSVLLRPKVIRLRPDKSIPRCITIDNGEKNNSFALCISRYYPEQDGILIEEFIEVAPGPHASVDLAFCYNDLILSLVKQLRVVHAVFDRWESGYAVADLRTNHSVDAQRYSLKWKDFEAFRADLHGMHVFMAKPEVPWRQVLATSNLVERAQWPRAHFQSQMLTVNEVGKTLQKPLNGNDDLFRAAVLAHYFITKHRELYKHNVRVEGGGRGGDHPVAMFFGRSSRGSRGSSAGAGQRPGGMSMASGGGRRGRR
jgi:hypothetical protein